MTEEMENKARKTHHQSKLTVYENIVTEDISVILRRIKSTPSVRKTLQARVRNTSWIFLNIPKISEFGRVRNSSKLGYNLDFDNDELDKVAL